MAIHYIIRILCETETGDGRGFHYCIQEQTVLDDTVKCTDHPEATVRDFVIEEVHNEE